MTDVMSVHLSLSVVKLTSSLLAAVQRQVTIHPLVGY